MHSSDRRMAPLPCLTAAVRAPLFGRGGAARRPARFLDVYTDPGRQADLAVSHDALSRLKTVYLDEGGMRGNAGLLRAALR